MYLGQRQVEVRFDYLIRRPAQTVIFNRNLHHARSRTDDDGFAITYGWVNRDIAVEGCIVWRTAHWINLLPIRMAEILTQISQWPLNSFVPRAAG